MILKTIKQTKNHFLLLEGFSIFSSSHSIQTRIAPINTRNTGIMPSNTSKSSPQSA